MITGEQKERIADDTKPEMREPVGYLRPLALRLKTHLHLGIKHGRYSAEPCDGFYELYVCVFDQVPRIEYHLWVGSDMYSGEECARKMIEIFGEEKSWQCLETLRDWAEAYREGCKRHKRGQAP